MAIDNIPGVGPQNTDVATAVAAAVPTRANIQSDIQTYAASAGLTASAIVTAGNAAGWAGTSPSLPLNTTSLVFAGYSSKGYYNYASNVSAGDYIFYIIPNDTTAKIIVSAPNTGRTTIGTNIYSQLNVSTTENPIRIWTIGTFTNKGTTTIGATNYSPGTVKTSIGYYNGNMWFTESGNYYVVYSTNGGVSWATTTASPAPSNPYGGYSTMFDGTGYWSGYYNAAYYSTSISSGWTTRSVGTVNDVQGLAYRSGATAPWVAAGGGGLSSSSNGTSWTLRVSTIGFTDVINAPSYLVAVGPYTATGTRVPLYYSTDGVTWTSNNSLNNIFGTSTSARADRITYGNGVYVVQGDYYSGTVKTPTMAWSTDLTNWYTSLTLATTGSFTGLTFGNGVFYSIGYSAGNSTPVAHISQNGAVWTSISMPNQALNPYNAISANDVPKLLFRWNNNGIHTILQNIDNPTQIYMYAISGQAVLN